jgi:hypothetical protein
MKKPSRDTRKRRGARFVADRKQAILQELREAFEKKFGRPPGPNDPIFFDPDADEPRKLSLEKFDKDVLTSMQAAKVQPEIIYAYKKTGLLLIDRLMETYPLKIVGEWEAAIDEYFAMEGQPEHSDAPPEKDADGPKLPPTEIQILKEMPLSGNDRQLVADTLFAVDNVLSGPVTVRTRLEIASMLLASACGAAYDSAAAQGHPKDAEERYEVFEQLAAMRARELFEGRKED